MEKKIDYLRIDMSQELIDKSVEKVRSILQKGNFILGEDCEKFENNITGYFGCKYALGVGSGFAALFLALCAIGVGEGDEVVTVANSFVATVAAARLLRAKVVYCDVDSDRNMSVDDLKKAVSARTKAIIVVHLAGIAARIDEIADYARQKGIECKIHYPIPIHKQQASIDSIGEVFLPKTEAQNERILSLPVYPGLKDDQVDYIIRSVAEYYS